MAKTTTSSSSVKPELKARRLWLGSEERHEGRWLSGQESVLPKPRPAVAPCRRENPRGHMVNLAGIVLALCLVHSNPSYSQLFTS